MTKTRTILISAVAVGLLAGSAVGVAGQETEAPSEFSATWDTNFGPGVRPNLTSGSDPIHNRGYANHPLIIESAGDPRFEGEVTMTVNRDEYPSLGALTVFHRAFTVENQEGIWRGVPHPMVQFLDDSESGATQLFVGERAYAGSYALADIQPDDDRGVWMIRGVIFKGEPPPAPEPFVAE